MTEMGSSAAQATATAVLPTPVGPTRTGTRGRSAPPKSPLQLALRQLHDGGPPVHVVRGERRREQPAHEVAHLRQLEVRSEEHTSELQSQSNLVCRLLLEKKKTTKSTE